MAHFNAKGGKCTTFSRTMPFFGNNLKDNSRTIRPSDYVVTLLVTRT